MTIDRENENQPIKREEITIRVLNEIMSKTSLFIRHFDTQVQILTGISSGLFLFSASQCIQKYNLIFIILSIASGLSAMIGLYAIHPPRWMRKQRQEESLFYNKKVAGFHNGVEYEKELSSALSDYKELFHQYSTEIYNMYKYYYRPKRELFNLSRNVLVIGVFGAILALIIHIFSR